MSLIEKVVALFWLNTKRQDDKRIATLTVPEGITEVNSIEYMSDGHRYHQLDVYYPEGTAGKLPVIIDVHGGGWAYGDKELNKIYCLTLAKKGYVVFNMSYRLYPEAYAKQQLEDIREALVCIKESLDKFPCDENNIFLTGDSAGGMLAAFTAMLSQSSEMRHIFGIEDTGLRFNAVGLTSPVAYMDDKLPVSFYTNLMLGKDFRKEKWAPYVNFDRLLPLGKMPPTFLVTSSGDFIARKQTLRCAKDLKERGVEYQLMDFEKFGGKDLPHVFPVIFPSDEAGDRAIEEMLRFFRKHSK